MSDKKLNKSTTSLIVDNEIDLVVLVKTVWEARRIFFKTTLIFMVIGIFVAIFSEKVYTGNTTFMPQSSNDSKISGNLGSLASLAGINLGSLESNSGISPTLYPQILNSITFKKKMLQTPLEIENQNKKVTFRNYYLKIYKPSLFGYIKKYTLGLPAILIKAIKGESKLSVNENYLISFTKDDQDLFDLLSDQIKLEVNETDGYVSISVNMPQPIAAAEMTDKVKNLLQEFVINFKIKKAKEQLDFVKQRFQEREKDFKAIQNNLALFQDRNQDLQSAQAQTILKDLQSEYDLAFGVYSELAKQLEAQELQVKKDTPVFMVINPVAIPIEKSEPKRIIIILIWSIFGGIFGIGSVFIKKYISDVKAQW